MLGLSNCYEVTGVGVLALAEHATGLCRLELYNCEVLDEHLEGFSRVSQCCSGCTAAAPLDVLGRHPKGCGRVSQAAWLDTVGGCCPCCISLVGAGQAAPASAGCQVVAARPTTPADWTVARYVQDSLMGGEHGCWYT